MASAAPSSLPARDVAMLEKFNTAVSVLRSAATEAHAQRMWAEVCVLFGRFVQQKKLSLCASVGVEPIKFFVSLVQDLCRYVVQRCDAVTSNRQTKFDWIIACAQLEEDGVFVLLATCCNVKTAVQMIPDGAQLAYASLGAMLTILPPLTQAYVEFVEWSYHMCKQKEFVSEAFLKSVKSVLELVQQVSREEVIAMELLRPAEPAALVMRLLHGMKLRSQRTSLLRPFVKGADDLNLQSAAVSVTPSGAAVGEHLQFSAVVSPAPAEMPPAPERTGSIEPRHLTFTINSPSRLESASTAAGCNDTIADGRNASESMQPPRADSPHGSVSHETLNTTPALLLDIASPAAQNPATSAASPPPQGSLVAPSVAPSNSLLFTPNDFDAVHELALRSVVNAIRHQRRILTCPSSSAVLTNLCSYIGVNVHMAEPESTNEELLAILVNVVYLLRTVKDLILETGDDTRQAVIEEVLKQQSSNQESMLDLVRVLVVRVEEFVVADPTVLNTLRELLLLHPSGGAPHSGKNSTVGGHHNPQSSYPVQHVGAREASPDGALPQLGTSIAQSSKRIADKVRNLLGASLEPSSNHAALHFLSVGGNSPVAPGAPVSVSFESGSGVDPTAGSFELRSSRTLAECDLQRTILSIFAYFVSLSTVHMSIRERVARWMLEDCLKAADATEPSSLLAALPDAVRIRPTRFFLRALLCNDVNGGDNDGDNDEGSARKSVSRFLSAAAAGHDARLPAGMATPQGVKFALTLLHCIHASVEHCGDAPNAEEVMWFAALASDPQILQSPHMFTPTINVWLSSVRSLPLAAQAELAQQKAVEALLSRIASRGSLFESSSTALVPSAAASCVPDEPPSSALSDSSFNDDSLFFVSGILAAGDPISVALDTLLRLVVALLERPSVDRSPLVRAVLSLLPLTTATFERTTAANTEQQQLRQVYSKFADKCIRSLLTTHIPSAFLAYVDALSNPVLTALFMPYLLSLLFEQTQEECEWARTQLIDSGGLPACVELAEDILREGDDFALLTSVFRMFCAFAVSEDAVNTGNGLASGTASVTSSAAASPARATITPSDLLSALSSLIAAAAQREEAQTALTQTILDAATGHVFFSNVEAAAHACTFVGAFRLRQPNCAAEKPFFLDAVPSLIEAMETMDRRELRDALQESLLVIAEATGQIRSTVLLKWALGRDHTQLLRFLHLPADVLRQLPYQGEPKTMLNFWAPLLAEAPRRSELRFHTSGGVTVAIDSWPEAGLTISAWFRFRDIYPVIPLFEFVGMSGDSTAVCDSLAVDDGETISVTHNTGGSGAKKRSVMNENNALEGFSAKRWVHFSAVLSPARTMTLFYHAQVVGTIELAHVIQAKSRALVHIGFITKSREQAVFALGDIQLWFDELTAPQVLSDYCDNQPHQYAPKILTTDVPRELSVHGAATVVPIPMGSRVARFVPHATYGHHHTHMHNVAPSVAQRDRVSAEIIHPRIRPPSSFISFHHLFLSRGGLKYLLQWIGQASTKKEMDLALKLFCESVRVVNMTETMRPRIYTIAAYVLKSKGCLVTNEGVKSLVRLLSVAVPMQGADMPIVINRMAIDHLATEVEIITEMSIPVASQYLAELGRFFDVASNRFARRNYDFCVGHRPFERILHGMVHVSTELGRRNTALFQLLKRMLVASDFHRDNLNSILHMVSALSPTTHEMVSEKEPTRGLFPHGLFVQVSVESRVTNGSVPLRTSHFFCIHLLNVLMASDVFPTHTAFAQAVAPLVTLPWFVAVVHSRFACSHVVAHATRLFADAVQFNAELQSDVAANVVTVVNALLPHCLNVDLLMVLLAAAAGLQSRLERPAPTAALTSCFSVHPSTSSSSTAGLSSVAPRTLQKQLDDIIISAKGSEGSQPFAAIFCAVMGEHLKRSAAVPWFAKVSYPLTSASLSWRTRRYFSCVMVMSRLLLPVYAKRVLRCRKFVSRDRGAAQKHQSIGHSLNNLDPLAVEQPFGSSPPVATTTVSAGDGFLIPLCSVESDSDPLASLSTSPLVQSELSPRAFVKRRSSSMSATMPPTQEVVSGAERESGAQQPEKLGVRDADSGGSQCLDISSAVQAPAVVAEESTRHSCATLAELFEFGRPTPLAQLGPHFRKAMAVIRPMVILHLSVLHGRYDAYNNSQKVKQQQQQQIKNSASSATVPATLTSVAGLTLSVPALYNNYHTNEAEKTAVVSAHAVEAACDGTLMFVLQTARKLCRHQHMFAPFAFGPLQHELLALMASSVSTPNDLLPLTVAALTPAASPPAAPASRDAATPHQQLSTPGFAGTSDESESLFGQLNPAASFARHRSTTVAGLRAAQQQQQHGSELLCAPQPSMRRGSVLAQRPSTTATGLSAHQGDKNPLHVSQPDTPCVAPTETTHSDPHEPSTSGSSGSADTTPAVVHHVRTRQFGADDSELDKSAALLLPPQGHAVGAGLPDVAETTSEGGDSHRHDGEMEDEFDEDDTWISGESFDVDVDDLTLASSINFLFSECGNADDERPSTRPSSPSHDTRDSQRGVTVDTAGGGVFSALIGNSLKVPHTLPALQAACNGSKEYLWMVEQYGTTGTLLAHVLTAFLGTGRSMKDDSVRITLLFCTSIASHVASALTAASAAQGTTSGAADTAVHQEASAGVSATPVIAAAPTQASVAGIPSLALPSPSVVMSDTIAANLCKFVVLLCDRIVTSILPLEPVAPFLMDMCRICQRHFFGSDAEKKAQLRKQLVRVAVVLLSRPEPNAPLLNVIGDVLQVALARDWDCPSQLEELLRIMYLNFKTPPAVADFKDVMLAQARLWRIAVNTYAGTPRLKRALTGKTITQTTSLAPEVQTACGAPTVAESLTRLEQLFQTKAEALEFVMVLRPKTKYDEAIKKEHYMKMSYQSKMPVIAKVRKDVRDRAATVAQLTDKHWSSFGSQFDGLGLPAVDSSTLHWLWFANCVFVSASDAARSERHYFDGNRNFIPFSLLLPFDELEGDAGLGGSLREHSPGRPHAAVGEIYQNVSVIDASLCEEQVGLAVQLFPNMVTRAAPLSRSVGGGSMYAVGFADGSALPSKLSASAVNILRFMIGPGERVHHICNAFRVQGIHATPCVVLLTDRMLRLYASARLTSKGEILFGADEDLGLLNSTAAGTENSVGSSSSGVSSPLKKGALARIASRTKIVTQRLHHRVIGAVFGGETDEQRQHGAKLARAVYASHSNGKVCRGLVWSYYLNNVNRLQKVQYLHQDCAMTITMAHDDNPLIAVMDEQQSMNATARDALYRTVLTLVGAHAQSFDEAFKKDRQVAVTDMWVNRSCSNFEYLMFVNSIADRIRKDWNQYPIFPWVLKDYTSPTLDLSTGDAATVYRDLRLPIGAQLDDRREELRERYNILLEERYQQDEEHKRETEGQSLLETIVQRVEGDGKHKAQRTHPFHYGSHYSSAGGVLYFMIRVEPFTTRAKLFQGGDFDHADRLFFSVADCYKSCTRAATDCKELTPEFYSRGQFLRNHDRLDLGARQDGVTVDDVVLPPWAQNSVQVFVAAMRYALESEYVSSQLHSWLDLLFGIKQRGKYSVEAFNVYQRLTYGEEVRKALLHAPTQLDCNAIVSEVENFGQTPPQLFAEPHPSRRTAALPMASSSVRVPQMPIEYGTAVPLCDSVASVVTTAGDSLDGSQTANSDAQKLQQVSNSSVLSTTNLSMTQFAAVGQQPADVSSVHQTPLKLTHAQTFFAYVWSQAEESLTPLAGEPTTLPFRAAVRATHTLALREPKVSPVCGVPPSVSRLFSGDTAADIVSLERLASGSWFTSTRRVRAVPGADLCICWHEHERKLMRYSVHSGAFVSAVQFNIPEDSPEVSISALVVCPREVLMCVGTSLGTIYCVHPDSVKSWCVLGTTLVAHTHPVVLMYSVERLSRLVTFTDDPTDFPVVWRTQRMFITQLHRLPLDALLPDTDRVAVGASICSREGTAFVVTPRRLAVYDADGGPCGVGTLPSPSDANSTNLTVYSDMSAVQHVATCDWCDGRIAVVAGHIDGTISLWSVRRLPPAQLKPGAIMDIRFMRNFHVGSLLVAPAAGLPQSGGQGAHPPTNCGGVTSICQPTEGVVLFLIAFQSGECLELALDEVRAAHE